MADKAFRFCKFALVVMTVVNVAEVADAVGGRRLLQNPDLPSQRSSNPSWLNQGSGSQSQQSDSSSQGQPQTLAQPQSQNALNDMLTNLGSTATSSLPVVIFTGGLFGAGWSDSSYGGRPFTSFAPAGKDSGTASCHYLPVGAAKSFYGPQASFEGKRALQLWAYAGATGVPDVNLVVSGTSPAACRQVPLSSVSIADSTANGWVKYWVDLNRFSWTQQASGSFSGCGSSGTSVNELVKLDFLNTHPEYEALLCIDDIRLMP